MRRTPLAKAKAHLSELVDAAQHRGQRTLILRHGKPAAALVPVEVAQPLVERSPMSAPEAALLLDRLIASGPHESTMSLEEALGRGRLESPQ